MQVSEFKSDLYNHVFSILDGEDVHSSPCGVGGERAAEIATKIAELAERLLSEDTNCGCDSCGWYDRQPGSKNCKHCDDENESRTNKFFNDRHDARVRAGRGW